MPKKTKNTETGQQVPTFKTSKPKGAKKPLAKLQLRKGVKIDDVANEIQGLLDQAKVAGVNATTAAGTIRLY